MDDSPIPESLAATLPQLFHFTHVSVIELSRFLQDKTRQDKDLFAPRIKINNITKERIAQLECMPPAIIIRANNIRRH